MAEQDLNRPRDYMVECRFLVSGEGWKKETTPLPSTRYSDAGLAASRLAKALDEKYGDDHFWTVELHDDPRSQYGAYFQLFHGRTS